MDKIQEMILDGIAMNDVDTFLRNSNDGKELNTENIYFAHTIFVDENGLARDGEYRALINSNVKLPHNRFFTDIINPKSLSILGGFEVFPTISNTGRCVDGWEKLSDKMGKDIASLDEIKEFINKQNLGKQMILK